MLKTKKTSDGLLINKLEDIDSVNVLTDRVRRRKQARMEAIPRICSGRSHAATMSWKETDGEHIYMRRAKLFARICEEVPIAVFDGELIVGSQTPYVRGMSPAMDWGTLAAEEIVSGMKKVGRSEVEVCAIGDEDLKLIAEDLEFWRGKTPNDIATKAIDHHFGTAHCELLAAGVSLLAPFPEAPLKDSSCDFSLGLNKGLKGVIAEAEEKVKALKFQAAEDGEKWYFYQAVIIAMKGMITYAKRYARLARELADHEANPQRKRELERIAQTCEWVPENPARTFYEAVQSFRFLHLGLNLEKGGANEVPGRVDQFLFPSYRRDMKEGRLTVQEAAELMACLLNKFNEMECAKPGILRKLAASHHGTSVTIGGVDRKGNDATNELSYLVLKVAKELKLAVSIYVRVHENTPDDFLIRGIECNRAVGGGIPSFINDKRSILNFVEDCGIPIEEAREYDLEGCVRPCFSHSGGDRESWPSLNGPKLLELVMYNGFDPRTKKQVGLQTGDPRTFTSIEQWIEAWQKQYEYCFRLLRNVALFAWHIHAQVYASPYDSALTNDCLDKGTDVERGGTRYPQLVLNSVLHVRANMGNSLEAMKKLVYEEKKITVEQLLDACAHNFEGNGRERIREMLLAAPKYGNDEDEPDEMMKRVSMWTSRLAASYRNPYGYLSGEFRPGGGQHYVHGLSVGALPDGRKAWQPLADGGISPMAGSDIKGPTAVMRSAARIVDIHANRGAVLNQKFSPALVSTRENVLKLVSMIRTYFEDYLGWMVQYNILSREQLLAAKTHPEENRDLLVRIGGYSAYFVELPPALQDEIIARTEQEL